MEFQFETLSPNILVDDVNDTIAYYETHFDFSLVASVPESGERQWAMIQRNGITLMFQTEKSIQEDIPGLHIDRKGSHGTFFIKLKGIDELFERVNGKVEIADPMRTTFYGMREFTVKDLNGYFLTFAEEAAT